MGFFSASYLRKYLLSSVPFVCLASVILFFIALVYFIFIKPPQAFPRDEIVVISKGETVSSASEILSGRKVIRSPLAFKAFMTVFGGSRGLLAGDYYFNDRQNVITVAWRLSHGKQDLKTVRITIPEGTNMFEVASLFEKRFYNFDAKEFFRIASTSEGYLFPDTYLFLPNVEAETVFTVMRSRFDEKIRELDFYINRFNKPLSDIIKMASIIEEEARVTMTRQMIAGILWKRISIKMPLQVDAAFAYVNGKKDSRLLTLDDLKIDSPYNTYVYRGLPPTPISSPGLDAIRAAVTPISSKYLFYLSDDEGEMHYAVTHDEHVANKDKYLR